MVYTYTPTYYSSFQDTITSLCKTVLPFSFKKKRLTAFAAAEQTLANQQSENLKWQQESFHKILNLMGLHKEGILPETEVFTFRSHLLESVTASPMDHEPAIIIRDKMQFLQELFYSKCITEDEYHSSKRPLLQRLAVQGAEIDCRDVIVARAPTPNPEEWSSIDIKDEQSLIGKDSAFSKNKAKHRSPLKQIKGAVSMLSAASPYKSGKINGGKRGISNSMAEEEPICPDEAFTNATKKAGSYKENINSEKRSSILMPEGSPPPQPANSDKEKGTDKPKKKAFRSLFGGDNALDLDQKVEKSAKKQWSFKKWKKGGDSEDESMTPYLLRGEERSDDVTASSYRLIESPIGEGPNTKLIKKKIHSDGSASDFFIDKVLGENIKKELSRIQGELCTANPNLNFSNEQIEAISTRLPVDKADLKKFFPKSWCDRYGDIVLGVVKKEFKDHVGEMETLRNAAREKQQNNVARWGAFEDDGNENFHPNLFSSYGGSSAKEDCHYNNNSDHNNNRLFSNNPFYDDNPESAFFSRH